MSARPFASALAALLLAVPCSLIACGTELVQTAREGARGPLDCSLPVELALPRGAPFGDGSEPLSALVGDEYSASEGPGLYVTARDAFRVYLNGKLVVESKAAREAVFVPLTLLPGTNAVTAVVAAEQGTPAALLQLDELTKSYVSNTGWKASSSPEEGFTEADFDDSSWAVATDYGPLGSLPGCDPEGVFESGSEARWIGPDEGTGKVVALRKTIRIAASGYGAGTTGGGDAAPQVVETWEDLVALASDPDAPAVLVLAEGVHDFRDEPQDQLVCPSTCTEDPAIPQYTVLVGDQTCAVDEITRPRTARTLEIGSNKTLVGLGRGAQLRGLSLDLGASQNVIVRNVTLYDVNYDLIEAGDAFTIGGASQVWLDHCTMKRISDGLSDVGDAQNVTFSWMHYDGVTPAACRGQHTRGATVAESTMTIHHCYFDHVMSHSPRVDGSTSRVHVYNNLLSDNLSYGVAAVCGAQVLVEGNTFQRIATPTARTACSDDTGLGMINARAGSNEYKDDVGNHAGGDGMEPHDEVFTPPYEYTVDPTEGWVTILSRAGAGGPWALPLTLD